MYPKVMNVSAITANDSTAQEELGTLRYTQDATNGLRKWKYVQFNNGAGNVASVANMVVCAKTTDVTGNTVTNDISDSAANKVAGVMPVAMTDLYYGWLQIGGYNSAIATNGDDDIADGVTLIASGDGTCDSVAAGTASTYKPLGYAMAADVVDDNTVAGMITVGEF
jgi:hypothetical protein